MLLQASDRARVGTRAATASREVGGGPQRQDQQQSPMPPVMSQARAAASVGHYEEHRAVKWLWDGVAAPCLVRLTFVTYNFV